MQASAYQVDVACAPEGHNCQPISIACRICATDDGNLAKIPHLASCDATDASGVKMCVRAFAEQSGIFQTCETCLCVTATASQFRLLTSCRVCCVKMCISYNPGNSKYISIYNII